MTTVDAIVKPVKLEEVKTARSGLGIRGMNAQDSATQSHVIRHKELYRGAEYVVEFLPKMKIEVVVPEDLLENTVKAIVDAASTGRMGDGKIFVSPVDDAVRIRTGESGDVAIG